MTIIGSHSRSKYYARTDNALRDMQAWMANQPDYMMYPLVIVDGFNNILQDSLHMLKYPAPLLESDTGSMNILGMPPYQYHDRFILLENSRYIIARPETAAIYIYDRHHELIEHMVLNVIERPIRNTDVDYALRNVSSEVRSRFVARIPDYKPPFLNIWVSHDHILLRTDNSEEGKHMVLLTMDGKPVGKLSLSEFDDIQYYKENRIYALHKNPDTGHSIRIYRVNL